VRTGGRGKHNIFSLGGAFRKAKYEIRRRRKKLESGSEGGQKFLPPNPLPFCPPERLDFRIKNSDFRQKKFEHQSKNTSVNNVNVGEKEANCFASGRDEKGFFLEGKSLARRGIPLSHSYRKNRNNERDSPAGLGSENVKPFTFPEPFESRIYSKRNE
jgi:hypothetical protein